MTHNAWWDERRAWEEIHGIDLPRFGPDDVAHAGEWHWREGRWRTPEQWRTALFAWEDQHGRLLAAPHAPFEPTGRGMYKLGTGRWEPL
jgi:hypothetical protein